MFGGYEISRAHRAELARVRAAEREEQQAQEAREEAARYKAAMLTPQLREEHEIALAAEVARAKRLEQAQLRAAVERVAAAEDFRDRLLQSGAGRWRTVQEVLAAAAGRP
jgi:hypothetical protein